MYSDVLYPICIEANLTVIRVYKHYQYINEFYVTSDHIRANLMKPTNSIHCPLSASLTSKFRFTKNLEAGFPSLHLLQPLFCDVFYGNLAVVDVLGSSKDGRPVLENGERHSFALAESNQVYVMLDINTLRGDRVIPCPFLAKRRSVSAAADKSDTPSPAYKSVGRLSAGRAAYGLISRDLL